MTLYEIDAKLSAIMAQIENEMEETGEISDETVAALDAVGIERSEKLENIACYIKELVYEADMFKAEKDKLAKRQKSAENRADYLKRYLTDALNGEKLKTSRVAVSYRTTSNCVDIEEGAEIPAEYLKPGNPDKTKLRAALLDGAEIAGVTLSDHTSTIIK